MLLESQSSPSRRPSPEVAQILIACSTSSTASLNPSYSNNKSPSSRRIEGYDRLIQHPAKLIPCFNHKDEPLK
ncbi:hypothetical protein DKX38_019205 [Salix brachista]|uniref:Uncharacterized protein n=1 Tax=Salix brachista TaxID=2182728 RepID=A0A5N5KFP3_9ROSI|nr:hypothetical protein DKX38_019205 [Salix brachista]